MRFLWAGIDQLKLHFMLFIMKVLQNLVIYQDFGGIMWMLQLVLVCKTNKGIASTSSSDNTSG